MKTVLIVSIEIIILSIDRLKEYLLTIRNIFPFKMFILKDSKSINAQISQYDSYNNYSVV
ncbi:hypothetical protein BpHYR1_032273 [Brachionus plicatilis]|uniref:Uncharacterized protein n=1 Tax=Brachionus plicatilis TaxID=10195 RepID=A0A3M7SNR0_BRAPC|nr:hypothetical protein BpHYR1_032273 [Brachionus plicatilis]